MMASDFIVDVSETDFEYEVIAYSQNVPVVVDFWAPWCQPCKLLTPILEGLATSSQGSFRLARINVDDNPNLAMRYGVRSIPTVKAFSQGQVVNEFIGLQPEARIKEFIERILPPSQYSLSLEKGASLLAAQNWSAAEQLYRDLDAQDPGKPAVQLGLIKSILAQGKASEAIFLLRNFPASREFPIAEKLRPLAEMLVRAEKNELPDENDLDAMFRNSLRLAGRGNLEAAMDGILEILRQDRRYRSDRARQVILSILELYDPADPVARQYRNELAAVLF
jgi:putative thioredoxin